MADTRITGMMSEDCLQDPILGAKVLLGYTIPAHLEARIWGMWTSKFMMDNSGYGTGKTLSIAIVSALRAMLMEDRVAGIISKTFNQGQLIFDYFDRWAASSPLFRSQLCDADGGEPDIIHGSMFWQARFKNSSKIRTIPPDFMRDAARVASEDWNDGYFDEFTKYPNYEAFWKNVHTRVRRPVCQKYDYNNPLFDRHFYFCGTARYQWHPSYKTVSSFATNAMNGDKKFEVQAWNYTHIPPKYHHLIELDGIKLLETSLPRDLAQQEVYGKWVRDSQGYYSYHYITESRSPDCHILFERAA